MPDARYVPPPAQTSPKPQSKVGAVVSLLLGLLYGISPIDLIPDILIPLGFSDDVVVLVTAVLLAIRFMRAKKSQPGTRPPVR